MKRSLSSLFAAAALLLVSSIVLASDGATYAEPKYEDKNGLTITSSSISMSSDRLVFKLTFWNKSDKGFVVDRDKLMLKMPDGSMKSRYKGMMTGWGMAGSTHDIPAHGSHEVHIEFVVGKDAPASATLKLDHGIIQEGKELSFSDYTATRR